MGGALIGHGEPEMLEGMRVSAGYFKLLGVSPMLGRDFRVEEDTLDTRNVAIISYSLWQRRLNSDPKAVGKQLIVSDQPLTIIGVMPHNFSDILAANYYEVTDIWVPLGYNTSKPFACRTCQHLITIARLKSGATLDQAREDMNRVMSAMMREHPESYATPTINIACLQDQFTLGIRPALYFLLVTVGFVFLIACTNVAHLLLIRGNERIKEILIRSALGASRKTIMRQMLIESLLLSIFSSFIGLPIALWGTDLLFWLSPAKIMQYQSVTIDLRLLCFTLFIVFITPLIFGLVPAWIAARRNLGGGAKESSRITSSKKQRHLRESIIITEIAFALLLLIAVGLLVRSFLNVLDVKPGFESRNLMTMMVSPISSKKFSDDTQVRAFYNELIRRVKSLPGAKTAAIVSNLPLGGNFDTVGFHIEEKPLANPANAPSPQRYGISPDYFKAMNIPLLRGRSFTDQDSFEAPSVAIINRIAATRLWPNENPIGKRIRLGSVSDELLSIVGIVDDVNHQNLETAPDMQVYVPHAQWSVSHMQLVVRTSNDPALIIDSVRQTIHSIDPEVPMYKVKMMRELLSHSVAHRRFTMLLVMLLTTIALLISAIGLYSVMSYGIAQRIREISIRIALGAQRSDVYRLVIFQALRIVTLGIILGGGAALFMTRLMNKLLFGVRSNDPVTIISVIFILSLISLLACYLPARRATKVDPMIVLRSE